MADIISDVDVVINLVGKYYDTQALGDVPECPYLRCNVFTSMAEANVNVPRAIAEICAETLTLASAMLVKTLHRR